MVEQLTPKLDPATPLSVGRAADYLAAHGMRVAPQTVGRWMVEGKLSYTQTPGPRGHRSVLVAELDRVLAAGRHPATTIDTTAKEGT